VLTDSQKSLGRTCELKVSRERPEVKRCGNHIMASSRLSFDSTTKFHEMDNDDMHHDGCDMTHTSSLTSTESGRRRYRKPTGYSTKEHIALTKQALEDADAQDRTAEADNDGEMEDMVAATSSMSSEASERIRTRKPTGYVTKEQARKAKKALAEAAREEKYGKSSKHSLSVGSSIGRQLLGCGMCGANVSHPAGISTPR